LELKLIELKLSFKNLKFDSTTTSTIFRSFDELGNCLWTQTENCEVLTVSKREVLTYTPILGVPYMSSNAVVCGFPEQLAPRAIIGTL